MTARTPILRPPAKFVQLIATQEGFLALDASGRLWSQGSTGVWEEQPVVRKPLDGPGTGESAIRPLRETEGSHG